MKGQKTPLQRKLRYVEFFASPEGVDFSLLRYMPRIDIAYANIGLNYNFGAILRKFLFYNAHIPIDLPFPVTYEGVEYSTYPLPEGFEQVNKGKYGKSKYGSCVVDPPLKPEDIVRIAWELRKALGYKDTYAYRLGGNTLKQRIDEIRKILTKVGVTEDYANMILRNIMIAEGKTATHTYWDCAVWDGSYWIESEEYEVRDINDPSITHKLKTKAFYDTHWDHAHWDYCRWSGEFTGIEDVHSYLDSFYIDAMQRGDGFVKQYNVKIFYPRIKWLLTEDKAHHKGGHEQIRQQTVIRIVKRILDEEGIPGFLRMDYFNFAIELTYKDNTNTRRFKKFKRLLSEDDIIDKYVSRGLDRNILIRIKNAIKPHKYVS